MLSKLRLLPFIYILHIKLWSLISEVPNYGHKNFPAAVPTISYNYCLVCMHGVSAWTIGDYQFNQLQDNTIVQN